MDNGQWIMHEGQWTMDNGQWTMVNAKKLSIIHYPLSIKKHVYIALLILVSYVNFSTAQDKPLNKAKIHAGYAFFLNYNLYSWYQKPLSIDNSLSSSGQVFNVLPGVGANLWVGNVDNWILALEAGVEYLPFALDISNYKGLGAVGFPMMAKFQMPVAKQQSLWLMVHAGLGAQLQKTDIYDRPLAFQNIANPFFATVIGELGFHISAVGYHRQHLREIEIFVRVGGAPLGAVSLNTGLRLTFWNRFK